MRCTSVGTGYGFFLCKRRFFPVLDFIKDIPDDVVAPFVLELLLHSPQGDAHNVAVMQFRAGVLLAQFEPHVVNETHVFGPESWWVGTEVYVNGRPARADDFQ